MITRIDVVEYLVCKGSDRTEVELATAIYGTGAYQQLVNQDCTMLVARGKIERRGAGGQTDPYRYHPK